MQKYTTTHMLSLIVNYFQSRCAVFTYLSFSELSFIFCVQILGCNEVDPLFKPRADGQVLQRTSGGYLHNLDFPALPYMTGTVRAEFGTFMSRFHVRRKSKLIFLCFLCCFQNPSINVRFRDPHFI